MGVFDLDAGGARAVDQQARLNPATTADIEASFFSHPFRGIGAGVMRGGAEVFDALGTLGKFFDEPGVDYTPADELQDELHKNAVDYWTPKASEVGTAGRVLGGLAEMTLPLMATGGNPALLIGKTVNKAGKSLVDRGVDARTATEAAVLEGTATAVGFKIPFLGKTLASRMASGAVGNLAVNTAATAGERALLLGGGYEELAKQYAPGDVESRAVDVLSGLAFGALAHVSMPPSDRAAVATAANAKHYQADTAPGHPVDTLSAVAHQDAMDQAVTQLMAGDPVTVPATLAEAQFTPRGRAPAPDLPPELKALDATRAAEPSTPATIAAAEPDTAVAPPVAAEPATPLSQESSAAAAEGAAPVAAPAEPAAAHPVVAAATEAAATLKRPIPTDEYTPEGAAATAPATEALTRAKAAVTEAKTFGKGILAAVNCALQSGPG